MDPIVVETIKFEVDDRDASRAYDGLEASQRDLARAVKSLESGIRDTFGGMGREAKGADRSVSKLNATLLNTDAALSLAQKGVEALRKGFDALRQPVDLATGFEAGVAQIRTLGQDLAGDFDEQLLTLAKDLPQTAGDLTRATYDAISAGIAPTNVIDFIRSTSQAAVAGGADLTESVGVLTTAVNAFPELAGDASRAADILFATVRAGVTDFRQLAATDIGAGLAGMGVRLDEVGALLAEFTKRGMSTSEALTTIQALTKSIVSPAGKAAATFKRLGVETGAAALKSKGLTAILTEINTAAGGNVEVIASLTKRQEALRGLVPLLTGGFEQYAATLETVRATQGATAESAAIMANTAQGAQARFRSLTEGVLTRLGRELLPQVNRLLDDLGAWLEANGDEFARTITEAVNSLIEMGRWAVGNGRELLRILGSIFVAKKVAEWTDAIKGAVEGVAGLGEVAEEVAPELAGKLFDPSKLGGALGAALRSPAFLGLLIGAATFIGTKMRETIVQAFREAEKEGRARVDLDAADTATITANAIRDAEVALASAFERGGEERLAGAAKGLRAQLERDAAAVVSRLQTQQQQVDAARAQFQASLAMYQETSRVAQGIGSLEEFLAAPEGTQERFPSLVRAAAEVTALGEAMANTGAEAQAYADAARQIPDIAAKIAKGATDAAPALPAPPEPEAPVATTVPVSAAPDTFFADVEQQAAIQSGLRARAQAVIDANQAMVDSDLAAERERRAALGRLSQAYAEHAARVEASAQASTLAILSEAQAYASAGSAALSSLSGIAEMAGASAGALATIKIAENIANATEQGAKALAAGAIGNIPGAVAHGAAAAQHVAAAVKWGVDALGGSGGGGGAGRVSAGAGGGAAPRSRPAALPPPQRQEPRSINVTINGVVATDQRAAVTLGGQMARGVAAQLQRNMSRRGAVILPPATAGARF